MGRMLAAVTMGLVLTAQSAFAADEQAAVSITPAIAAAASTLAQRVDFGASLRATPSLPDVRRPTLLPALYAGSAVLQSYDAYSTMSALNKGGVEANPLMKSVVKNPVAFVAVKASVTAASIVAAERLWKSNHRVGAVALMIVSNGVMGMVAGRNASVLRGMR
jgi:hypothetical protein